MSRIELLNNVQHQDLRVISLRGSQYGDGVSGCAVYPTEFNELQKYYPILFQKQSDDSWLTIALFGFEKDENLYLQDGTWNAAYIPAVIEREPFLIGTGLNAQKQETLMIHVDMDSPRIAKDGDGEALFLPYGGNTTYLDKVIKTLNVVHEGVQEAERMLKAFTELDLIEPVTIEFELKNSTSYSINNFATINKEKLLALTDVQVASLHRSGLLRYAYLILGSFTNLQYLVNQKNKSTI